MLERKSSAAGTRLTAPANSPSTRRMRLSPCLTSGTKRWITHGSRKLTEMRRGDVGEIERRVLPQQDDVECRKRLAPRLAHREMIAGLIAHGERLYRRDQLLAAQRKLVRRVIGKPVAALLRFQ